MRRGGGSKPCEVPGCQTPAKVGQLTCLPHWKSLPQRLQRDVNHAWREYRRASGPQAKLKAIGAYREARDAAIAYIVAGESPEGQAKLF